VVSQHLLGLNNRVLRKEVSPIHREDATLLLNSASSLFESAVSNQQTQRELRVKSIQKQVENSNNNQNTIDTKQSGKSSDEADLLSMSIDEFSEEKHDVVVSSNSEGEQEEDDNIEMKRIMKMNFYQFKGKDHNGIVGMCQNIKNRGKSPNNGNILKLNTSNSCLNNSINSCANL